MVVRKKLVETESVTFDDVLLVPSKSDVLPSDVDTSTMLTRKIKINIPLISAAMDTVTESSLAIAISKEGGLGVIHKNMGPEDQGTEVRNVKKAESLIIREPLTLSPNTTLGEVKRISKQHGISGFPVVSSGKVVGMICNRDIRFNKDMDVKVSEIMTKNVITGSEQITMEKAIETMSSNKIEKLPIIDRKGNLKGLITLTDIDQIMQYPLSSKDKGGHLLVGGAIGPFDDKRAEILIRNGVDVIVVDSAHGHSKNIIDCVKRLKKNYDIQVIAGNVATREATVDLISAGADAVKVGIGGGSICTSRIIAGVGVPQVTAVTECSEAAEGHNVPVISDGGTRYSGDIAKAIASGASSVMLGSLLAGTDESPGRQVFVKGRKFKSYRGMGSTNAMMSGSADRYFQSHTKKLVPEGIEGIVPHRGSVSEVIYQLVGGLRSSMGYCGCKTIDEMRANAKLRKISKAGITESHPHDVLITEEAPNYWKVD